MAEFDRSPKIANESREYPYEERNVRIFKRLLDDLWDAYFGLGLDPIGDDESRVCDAVRRTTEFLIDTAAREPNWPRIAERPGDIRLVDKAVNLICQNSRVARSMVGNFFYEPDDLLCPAIPSTCDPIPLYVSAGAFYTGVDCVYYSYCVSLYQVHSCCRDL